MGSPRFLKKSNFVGEILLETINDDNFDDLAFEFEYQTLNDLLGAKLYNEFIADLDINNEPQTPKFINLLHGETYQVDDTEQTINYRGLVIMLNYLFFEHFTINNISKDFQLGRSVSDVENSKKQTIGQLRYITNARYNKGVYLYNSAAFFVLEFEDIYFDDNDLIYWKPRIKSTKYLLKLQQPFNVFYSRHKSKCSKYCS